MAEEQTTAEPAAAGQTVHNAPKHQPPNNDSRLLRFKAWYAERKKWTIPASVLLAVLLLAGLPLTRYSLAGLAVKRDITVRVLDSAAGTPVSGADVKLEGLNAQTDAAGKAVLRHVKVGRHKVILSKKYYQDRTVDILTPILSKKTEPEVRLTATGRQVKITVVNLINKNPVANADIKAADTTAKTDKNGSAVMVLPAGAGEQKAVLSAEGFNDTQVTIKVSSDKIQDNSFNLTPAGKVYFLSKLSGKIDVVKTNLDGTGRQTVMAGTGNEDDRNTVLLASRDWKYLALLSRRAGSNASLYLINTSDDSSTVIDEGSADFTLTGWAGDNFIYTVSRASIQLWQPGRQTIKSFNAPAKKAIVLDQTTASGSDNFNYLTELIGDVYAYEDQVFYIKNWTASYSGSSAADIAAKQSTFNSVKPDGSAKKAIRSFGLAPGASAIDITLDERVKSPSAIELHFYDGTKDNFYSYSDGQVKSDASATAGNFYSAVYPTYLLSPSGSKTFWSEPRDGKNTLFTGDEEGQGSKQIASLSDYNTYGWFTDNYLFVSKNSSELYIMDKDGKQPAVKISDYHKPAQTFAGYGGGYGGL